jgi:hypothetical protein
MNLARQISRVVLGDRGRRTLNKKQKILTIVALAVFGAIIGLHYVAFEPYLKFRPRVTKGNTRWVVVSHTTSKRERFSMTMSSTMCAYPSSSWPCSTPGFSLYWGKVNEHEEDTPTIWIADAHRDDGRRFIVLADEKLTAFLELERVTQGVAKLAPPCSSFTASQLLP